MRASHWRGLVAGHGGRDRFAVLGDCTAAATMVAISAAVCPIGGTGAGADCMDVIRVVI